MSATLSVLLEMVTVCMIYEDNITLRSKCSVTQARWTSVWVSVEKSNVRAIGYNVYIVYCVIFYCSDCLCCRDCAFYFLGQKDILLKKRIGLRLFFYRWIESKVLISISAMQWKALTITSVWRTLFLRHREMHRAILGNKTPDQIG